MKKFYPLLSLMAMLFFSTQLMADHLSGSLQLTARMNGANEVPAVVTDAEGTLAGVGDKEGSLFT